MTLVEFLRARLDEDEQTARDCPGPAWEHRQIKGDFDESVVFEDYVSDRDDERVVILSDVTTDGVLPFVLRNDPARVLAEVEAKRRIIDEHRQAMPGWCETCDVPGDYKGRLEGCTTLRALALPYADHPDCDPAWRP